MPPRCQLLSGSFPKQPLSAHTPSPTPRSFTTSTILRKNPLSRRKGGDLGAHLPKYVIAKDKPMPEYPYGPSLTYKQSNKGLYGGKKIQFGNNVSRKTETKTRRNWKPNVLSKSLYSIALKKKVKLRVTASVLKIIDREGGLDEYLLKQSEHRIKDLGPTGWALRWTLLQKPSVIMRMREQAAALGLPQSEIDRQWPLPEGAPMDDVLEVAADAALDAVLQKEIDVNQDVVDTDTALEVENPAFEDGEANHAEEIAQITANKLREAQNEVQRRRHLVTQQAGPEYTKAFELAKRYVRRGMVDTKTDGIKLAFVRTKDRAEARERNAAAHKQHVEAAGGEEQYQSTGKSDVAAERAQKIASAGGEEAVQAAIREKALNQLHEAEHAQSNTSISSEERARLTSALEKAQLVIDAGSKSAYIEAVITKWEERNATKWPLSIASKDKGDEVQEDGGSWDELVNKMDTSSISRPRA